MNVFKCFSDADFDSIKAMAERAKFTNGHLTAVGLAKASKNNLQATEKDNPKLIQKIRQCLMNQPLFMGYSFALSIPTIMLNKYESGAYYGVHSDAATQSGLRSDMSFTIFLSDSSDYEGGELVMYGPNGTMSVKLAKNMGFLYSTTLLHEVTPVTSGSRLAIIGWVRSRVPDPRQRELLIELDDVRVKYRDSVDNKELALKLLKVSNDLKRFWLQD